MMVHRKGDAMEHGHWAFTTWAILAILAGSAIMLDSLIVGKRDVSIQQASWLSGWYIGCAMLFGSYIWVSAGAENGSRFFAGYLMEKALSVDNLMVFTAIFTYFGITSQHQQRHILHWGILGALVFRAIFVGLGVGALMTFGPLAEIIFGGLVAWSAWVMLRSQPGEDARVNYNTQWYIKLVTRIWPVSTRTTETLFRFEMRPYPSAMTPRIVRCITPAFICLVTIELSDIMFAFDSVPAVIGVTQDPLLVYSAVIFAVLGLRALYFVLHALRHALMHLDVAVAIVLVFIAIKLMAHALVGWEITPLINVSVVLSILTIGIVASMWTTIKGNGIWRWTQK